MKSVSVSCFVLAFALCVSGAPSSRLRRVDGTVKKDGYIVVLKDGVSVASHVAQFGSSISDSSTSHAVVTAQYTSVLNGYAAILTGAALQLVLDSKDVSYVEPDQEVQIGTDLSSGGESYQEERDEANEQVRDFVESRSSKYGAGVVVYGIDTGIFIKHKDFGGRASWGATFGGYASVDGNGHGTHTAATAVGTTYGIAKQAKVVAVKVLGDNGSGWLSDVISGVVFASQHRHTTGKPSIANLSLGGPVSTTLDAVIAAAIGLGLHVTVAAGNSNMLTSTQSPADCLPATSVGAIDNNNVKADFSNFGPGLDIWAPGVAILSAWIGNVRASARLSGTSMAAPYVAGILAVAISDHGNASPPVLTARLLAHALPVVTGAPAGTTNLKAKKW